MRLVRAHQADNSGRSTANTPEKETIFSMLVAAFPIRFLRRAGLPGIVNRERPRRQRSRDAYQHRVEKHSQAEPPFPAALLRRTTGEKVLRGFYRLCVVMKLRMHRVTVSRRSSRSSPWRRSFAAASPQPRGPSDTP